MRHKLVQYNALEYKYLATLIPFFVCVHSLCVCASAAWTHQYQDTYNEDGLHFRSLS